ncbi:MAG: hypothetical protein QF541_22980, partial [Lentisphaeria bacterium]|jgi:hypothetical protein|nr:hypothetical protein [Lentisphaeria bacterium]
MKHENPCLSTFPEIVLATTSDHYVIKGWHFTILRPVVEAPVGTESRTICATTGCGKSQPSPPIGDGG